ncbi:hypothetical protein MKW94_001683, partial [Papaver nudicaule]|nr:hypothetical protein [Papaver nudicaule]
MASNKRIHVDDEGIEKIDIACEQSTLVPKIKGLSLSVLRKVYSVLTAEIEKLRLERKEQEVLIEKLKLEKTEQQTEIERLRKELQDKDEALEESRDLNNVYYVKEHQQNVELEEIRKLVIR